MHHYADTWKSLLPGYGVVIVHSQRWLVLQLITRFMCNLGARDLWWYLIYRIQSNISPYGEAKPRSLSNIIMSFKYDKTETVPAADFLEPLHNSIKMWSFLWVIIPAIHHQINILWLYLKARNVGVKWRVFMHNHPVNDFCVKKNLQRYFV